MNIPLAVFGRSGVRDQPMKYENETLWLEPIPPELRDRAVAALDEGDAIGFLIKASNEWGLNLVYMNQGVLLKRGIYESALLSAFIDTRTSNHGWPLNTLRLLFEIADRDRLRAAGDPLPGAGPFTIFRGVAGRGRARRVRGFSWTASREKAEWFAERFAKELPELSVDPAVFQVTVGVDDVLAYSNERKEQEFIVLLPDSAKPVRVRGKPKE